MASIEQVWRNIFKSNRVLSKLTLGTILSLVPILNLFSLGYLYRVTMSIRQGEPINLPPWEDWQGLFNDGLKLLVILLVWMGVPVLLGSFVDLLLSAVRLQALGSIALMVSFPVGTMLCGASLYRYQSFESFKDAFDFVLIWRIFDRTISDGLLPLLAACGFFWILGWASVLAVFTLSLVIFIYLTSVFRALEKGHH